jgi:hypothetical protein
MHKLKEKQTVNAKMLFTQAYTDFNGGHPVVLLEHINEKRILPSNTTTFFPLWRRSFFF